MPKSAPANGGSPPHSARYGEPATWCHQRSSRTGTSGPENRSARTATGPTPGRSCRDSCNAPSGVRRGARRGQPLAAVLLVAGVPGDDCPRRRGRAGTRGRRVDRQPVPVRRRAQLLPRVALRPPSPAQPLPGDDRSGRRGRRAVPAPRGGAVARARRHRRHAGQRNDAAPRALGAGSTHRATPSARPSSRTATWSTRRGSPDPSATATGSWSTRSRGSTSAATASTSSRSRPSSCARTLRVPKPRSTGRASPAGRPAARCRARFLELPSFRRATPSPTRPTTASRPRRP